jgi:tetratricopeptide (TPR) repeat protein
MEWSDSTSNPILKQEYLTKSEKYLRKAIEIYPQNISTWLLLGNLYIKEKKYASARECFDNCLKINPTHPASLNNLLHIAQVTNRDKLYEESIIAYKDLLVRQPDSARNDFGIGLAFKNAGAIDSALFWFRRTLAKDSLYGDAWGKMGEIYGQVYNDLIMAENYLQRAVRCNPKDASSLENIGIVYAMRGNRQVAIDYFNKAYAITPDNVGLNRNMGKTYQDMGNAAKAQEHFQKAQQLEAQGKS